VRLVDRRIGLLFGLFLLLLLVGATRVTWLGTVRGEALRELAQAQQIEQLKVAARRGTISDRHGVELAVSQDAVTVFANPFLIKDPVTVAGRIAPLLDKPLDEVTAALGDRQKGFVYLKRKLDIGRGEAIKKLRIEGIGTVVEPKRHYPQGPLASQLLGTVGIDNVGLSGLERGHERLLHGSDDERRIVKDALGKPISIVDVRRGRAGRDLQLTLDVAIQERAEAVLGELGRVYQPKGATALVLNPRSGEILALANWPRVDANDVASAPPYARQNRAIEDSYEPGSTFKAFTVAGALEERLITPRTRFSLPPTIQVADRVIKEAHARGGVTLTVEQILAQSSNIGSVKIGLLLGKKRFDRWVRRFGFGRAPGVGLPGEAGGIVPKPAEYSGSSLGNLPIGQGLAVTPMQMAEGYSAIANNGLLRKPHILASDRRRPERIISGPTARRVARMLEGVLGPGGTAQEASVPGYKVAGKTGTAQKPDSQGGYSKDKYVASFIGFAPARRPRLLVAVMVDEPRGAYYGGVVAAPAFERILSFALPYLRIPPS